MGQVVSRWVHRARKRMVQSLPAGFLAVWLSWAVDFNESRSACDPTARKDAVLVLVVLRGGLIDLVDVLGPFAHRSGGRARTAP